MSGELRFRMTAILAVAIAASIVVVDVAGQHGGHALKLGTVVFPNSGNAAAQEPFVRGIALLHSYEYSDARDAFREAERADPTFALAYWAEAFTFSQFDWGTEDLAAARAALTRLAPTSEQRLSAARAPRCTCCATRRRPSGSRAPKTRSRSRNTWSRPVPSIPAASTI